MHHIYYKQQREERKIFFKIAQKAKKEKKKGSKRKGWLQEKHPDVCQRSVILSHSKELTLGSGCQAKNYISQVPLASR